MKTTNMTTPRRTFKYRQNNIVLILVAINLLTYTLQKIYPSLTYYLAMNPVLVNYGYVWQIATYMFAHGTIRHLVFNMLSLYIFGRRVEQTLGSTEFLVYYLVSGILAGAISFAAYTLTSSYHIFLLGASGAIFAVELAYAVIAPESIIHIWGILPVRAPILVLAFTAIEVVLTITNPQSNVAHLTHLAGFATGWLYFAIRLRVNPWKRLWRKR
jgi:membrane associated rhomboid family serine protease